MRASWFGGSQLGSITLLSIVLFAASADAFPSIREGFFTAYPSAVGSRLDDLPSRSGHCGVCHFRFSGGGPRNPYGSSVEGALDGFPDTLEGRRDAVLSIESMDSDGDGFLNVDEITDLLTYANTPTFPGLTPANVGDVSQVDLADILGFLVPDPDTSAPEGLVAASWGGIKSLYR